MSDDDYKLIGGTLPLIFVNERPKSLQEMENFEIRRFIEHLVDICGTRQNIQPIWWPRAHVEYNQFLHDRLDAKTLKIIVHHCYKFYNELFTLYASEQLAKYDFNALDIRPDLASNAYGIFEKATNELLAVATYKNMVRCEVHKKINSLKTNPFIDL